MARDLFTADPHFGHSNIVRYCARPFASSEEMDEAIIANWNTEVEDEDRVYILGDFALCSPGYARSIARRLKGRKFLIRGNHDRTADQIANEFEWIKDLHEVKINDTSADKSANNIQRITLCHYALRVWPSSHRGGWQLYGHSHGQLPDEPLLMSFDVGVDVWGFKPLPYDKVKEVMERRMAVRTEMLAELGAIPRQRDNGES